MSPHPGSRHARNVAGAAWVFASAVGFTVMTTLVRYLGDEYSASLQTFYRQLACVAVLLPAILRSPRTAFATRRPWMMVLRAGVTVAGFILTFTSFQLLPLANANALSFTRILWVVPLAALFLHERIGIFRIVATLCGFAGVLVMLHPAGMEIGLPQFAALAGALCLAGANIMAKALAGDHEMLPLLAWSAVVGLLAAAPPAMIEWRLPEPFDLLLLMAMGASALAVQISYIKGLTMGDTAAVVPVDYSRLLLAAAVGYLLFAEVPDAATIGGGAIVAISTLVIVVREQRAASRTHLAAESVSGEDVLALTPSACDAAQSRGRSAG